MCWSFLLVVCCRSPHWRWPDPAFSAYIRPSRLVCQSTAHWAVSMETPKWLSFTTTILCIFAAKWLNATKTRVNKPNLLNFEAYWKLSWLSINRHQEDIKLLHCGSNCKPCIIGLPTLWWSFCWLCRFWWRRQRAIDGRRPPEISCRGADWRAIQVWSQKGA